MGPVILYYNLNNCFVSVSEGLHDAADNAEGQRSSQISGILHRDPGNDVSE